MPPFLHLIRPVALLTVFLFKGALGQKPTSYDLVWASTGGGFRAMAASIGFANVFAQLGLFSEGNGSSSFSGISATSGSAWFATAFFFSQPYYTAVTNGTTEELEQFVLKLLTALENDQPDPVSGGDCLQFSDLEQVPPFEQFSFLCEQLAAYNFSTVQSMHSFFDSSLAALGDLNFAGRQATASNKVPALQSTDMLIQTAMSPVTRVGNLITYYGPDSEETEAYSTVLPLTYAVRSSSESFVSGDSTKPKFGYVYESPDTFNIKDYENTNGVYPPAANLELTYVISQEPLATVEWKEPWDGTPTVTQIAAASSAALGSISGIAPTVLAQVISVLDYNLANDSAAEDPERARLILNDVAKEQYQSGLLDAMNVCSVWPQECDIADSVLIDGGLSDGGSLAQNIAIYQAGKTNDFLKTTLKVIYSNNKRPDRRETDFAAYFRSSFNEDVPPGDYIWLPSFVRGDEAQVTPKPNKHIFEELLEEETVAAAYESTDDGSSVMTALFTGTTVDNSAYGVRAGQHVEILLIKTGSLVPTDLIGKFLTSLFKQSFADLATEISSNQILKNRVASFLEESPTSAPPTTVPRTSPPAFVPVSIPVSSTSPVESPAGSSDDEDMIGKGKGGMNGNGKKTEGKSGMGMSKKR